MSDDGFETHFELDPELKDALKALEKAENDIFLVEEFLSKHKNCLKKSKKQKCLRLHISVSFKKQRKKLRK